MNLLIKLSRSFLIILCTLTLFTSCDKDTEDEAYQYRYGLTSAINDQYEEIEAIQSAYCDAYKNAGLKFGNYVFALGTSKDKILKACSDAEFAILTSSRKFNGKYTYEIKYAGHSIYKKNYGTR